MPSGTSWIRLKVLDKPGAARLFIVVPKRLVRLAVERNRIKRLVREAVRRDKLFTEEGKVFWIQITRRPDNPIFKEVKELLCALKY